MNFNLLSARSCLALAVAFLLLFAARDQARAQVDAASLTGLVADANGAAVPGASVVLTNLETNISAQTATGEDGYYSFTNLRPGPYSITVERAGFRRETRPEFRLFVGQRARLDFTLAVGQVTEAVTITDEPLSLQREDASLGNTVDNRRITTLPLTQRTWVDILPTARSRGILGGDPSVCALHWALLSTAVPALTPPPSADGAARPPECSLRRFRLGRGSRHTRGTSIPGRKVVIQCALM